MGSITISLISAPTSPWSIKCHSIRLTCARYSIMATGRDAQVTAGERHRRSSKRPCNGSRRRSTLPRPFRGNQHHQSMPAGDIVSAGGSWPVVGNPPGPGPRYGATCLLREPDQHQLSARDLCARGGRCEPGSVSPDFECERRPLIHSASGMCNRPPLASTNSIVATVPGRDYRLANQTSLWSTQVAECSIPPQLSLLDELSIAASQSTIVLCRLIE